MSHKWLLCVTGLIIVINVKHIIAPKPASSGTRSTYIKPHASKPKSNRNLQDHRLGQEYIEQYQEMLKGSQESFEMFDERDEKRLRRVIGDDDLELMAEAGGLPRRRSVDKMQAAVGRRRARSQALRRDKLKVQRIKSHKLYSKLISYEYDDD